MLDVGLRGPFRLREFPAACKTLAARDVVANVNQNQRGLVSAPREKRTSATQENAERVLREFCSRRIYIHNVSRHRKSMRQTRRPATQLQRRSLGLPRILRALSV